MGSQAGESLDPLSRWKERVGSPLHPPAGGEVSEQLVPVRRDAPSQPNSPASGSLSRRGHDPAGFDLAALAAAADGFSGAETEAAVVAASYPAFAAGRSLAQGDLLAEVRGAVPLSRSRGEDVQAHGPETGPSR